MKRNPKRPATYTDLEDRDVAERVEALTAAFQRGGFEADPNKRAAAEPTITLDAAAVARLRRKARRVLTSNRQPARTWADIATYGCALARDLLRVLDGTSGRKR